MKKRGQVTLLVLLLGLLGLTIALSSVSRSLNDVHQAIQSDSGAKALAAAEAGLEYGLSQIPAQADCLPHDLSGSSNFQGFATLTSPLSGEPVKYTICSNSGTDASIPNMGVDDILSVDLTAFSGAQNLGVLWGGAGSAVEITGVYANNTIKRFAVNDFTSAPSANQFSAGQDPSNCFVSNVCGDSTGTYDSCSTNAKTSPQSSAVNRIDPTNLSYLRIRRLYNSGDVAVCAFNNPTPAINPVAIGSQTYIVTATARTKDGTVRRVQAAKVGGGLSGIFDYSLYTEGTLTK